MSDYKKLDGITRGLATSHPTTDERFEATPPDRSVEDAVEQFLRIWPADREIEQTDLTWLRTTLTSLHTQGFEAGRRETEKAFGGCTKCYGKGYATVKENYTHHADFIGDKTYTTPAPIMRFCSCERGKALATLKHPNEPV